MTNIVKFPTKEDWDRVEAENHELAAALINAKRRTRALEDENASLKKHLDRQGEKYKKLVDRMIELLFGDGECL